MAPRSPYYLCCLEYGYARVARVDPRTGAVRVPEDTDPRFLLTTPDWVPGGLAATTLAVSKTPIRPVAVQRARQPLQATWIAHGIPDNGVLAPGSRGVLRTFPAGAPTRGRACLRITFAAPRRMSGVARWRFGPAEGSVQPGRRRRVEVPLPGLARRTRPLDVVVAAGPDGAYLGVRSGRRSLRLAGRGRSPMSEAPAIRSRSASPGRAALDDCLRALRRPGCRRRAVHGDLPGRGQAATGRWRVRRGRDRLRRPRHRGRGRVVAGAPERLERAASDLACLGGPIGVRFPDGRPRWLGDGLLGAFGPLDYGDTPSEIDPFARTLMGGTSRSGPTRCAEWAASGPREAATTSSTGSPRSTTRSASSPASAGARPTTRRSRPRGWCASGRPRALRPAPAALRGAARAGRRRARRRRGRARSRRGAAGAALALARGRRALAVERAARAAENAGILVAERVAGADFQPVTAATPFRHTVPLPESRPRASGHLRRRRDGAPVPPGRDPRVDPLGLCVTPEHFAQHIQVLSSDYRPVALAELADCVRRGNPPPPDWVAVTFDDGYEDNRAALKTLAEAEIPATLFASTGHVEEGRWFWWDELDVALRQAGDGDRGPLGIEIAGSRRAWAPATAEQRMAVRAQLHTWLASSEAGQAAAAAADVRRWAGMAASQSPPDDYRPMTVDELRDAASLPGVEIGAHTRNHPSLAQLGGLAAAGEIAASRDDLERWLGAAPRSFSYPFGIPEVDFTAETRRAAAAAGFAQAVSNAPGHATAASDLHALPRNVVPDCDGERFARWLATGSAADPSVA